MNCLKCGRETEENQVFCQRCLEDMQRFPVRPGSPVILPRRREAAPPKRVSKRRGPSPEEQLRSLRRRSRILAVCLAAALLLAGVLAYPAWKYVDSKRLRPGQNYTAITTTVDTAPDTDTAD